MEFTVGITGASGAIYAQRTLIHLAASAVVDRINLIISGSAETVARAELAVDLRGIDRAGVNRWLGLPADSQLIQLNRLDNMAARPSSGSHQQEGMVIVPCSMATLGVIEALVDHLVFRILDHLGVPHSGATRWKGLPEQELEATAPKD